LAKHHPTVASVLARDPDTLEPPAAESPAAADVALEDEVDADDEH